MLEGKSGTHSAIADRFVQDFDLQPIGLNWEMLDSTGDEDVPRSAVAAFDDALGMDMVFTKVQWLGHENAKSCGLEFLNAFSPEHRIILTNRMYFGWNPISRATFEWAFIGMDDTKIALLLVMAED